MSPASENITVIGDPILQARVDHLLDMLSRYLSAIGERRETLEAEVKEAIRLVREYTPKSYVEPIKPASWPTG